MYTYVIASMFFQTLLILLWEWFPQNCCEKRLFGKPRYVDGTPISEVTAAITFYINPPQYGQIRLQLWLWMIDSHSVRFVSVGPPIPEIGLFQTLTLKIQGQDHGYGQRSRSHSQPSIQLICFHVISHQSDRTENNFNRDRGALIRWFPFTR